MRSSTAGENTALAADSRQTYYRAKVADVFGVMQDMGSLVGFDWVHSWSITEDIDANVATATVYFYRQQDTASGVVSLSPLRTDSAANASGPAVDTGRAIWLEMAVVAGARPASGSSSWKRKFTGVTDTIDFPDQYLAVNCRDLGCALVDQVITASPGNLVNSSAASLTNPTLEKLINALLRYAPSVVGANPYTVYVPTDPVFIVHSFPVSGDAVMDACIRAAQLGACDFRFYWDDASGSYRPTLIVIDRAPAVTVATITADAYVGVKQIQLDRLQQRNLVNVTYKKSTDSLGIRSTVSAGSVASGDYIRAVTIQEADDSSIDTETEAQDLADLILLDIKDPKSPLEVECLADWRIELHDYLTFAANQYFDIDRDLAVVGIRHEMRPTVQRTFLRVRGTPAAAYTRWLKRAFVGGRPQSFTAADNGLTNVQHTDDDTAGTRTYTWDRGGNVSFVAFYETLAAAGSGESAFPDAASVKSLGSILSSATDSWVATKPPRGKQRFGIAVPYFKLGGGYQQGAALKWIIDPLPSNLGASVAESNDAAVDGFVDLVLLVVGSKSDWPVTLEVWIGEETGAADYSYTANAISADVDAGISDLKGLAPGVGKPRAWSLKATNVAGEVSRATYTERVFTATKTLTIPPTGYVVPSGVSFTVDSSGQLNFSGTAHGLVPIGLAPGVVITTVAADVFLDGAHLPTITGINGLIEYAGNDVAEISVQSASASVGGWQSIGGSPSYTVTTSPLYFRQLYLGGTGIKYGPLTITYFMPSQDKAL